MHRVTQKKKKKNSVKLRDKTLRYSAVKQNLNTVSKELYTESHRKNSVIFHEKTMRYSAVKQNLNTVSKESCTESHRKKRKKTQ